MKKLILLNLLQLLSAAGFSQTLPFDDPLAIHFRATNMVVRWKAPEHPWPRALWTYWVVPTIYSSATISNLMALGPFAETDKQDYGANLIVFSNSGRVLHMRPLQGQIEYSTPYKKGIAKEVPETNQLARLTTNFLHGIGIGASQIPKRRNGQLDISWPDPADSYTFFYPGGNMVISNIQSRTVRVSRALDGVLCTPAVGDARIEFGERGVVCSLSIDWRSVERDKSYTAATPKRIMQWIREGRAIQKHMLGWWTGQETMINWPTVKGLTITKATAYYRGDLFFERESAHQPILPSWVVPYAEISATVSTGKTNLEVEIVCPVIDETKPLRAGPASP